MSVWDLFQTPHKDILPIISGILSQHNWSQSCKGSHTSFMPLSLINISDLNIIKEESVVLLAQADSCKIKL